MVGGVAGSGYKSQGRQRIKIRSPAHRQERPGRKPHAGDQHLLLAAAVVGQHGNRIEEEEGRDTKDAQQDARLKGRKI